MSDSTITLAAAIGPNDELITVSAAATSHVAPFIGFIGTEAILFIEGTQGTTWRGRRGYADTAKATHAINATITIISQRETDRAGLAITDTPAAFTLTPAAGSSNVCEVTIQAKDAAGNNLARSIPILIWLSDAATGIGLTATSASGAVAAKASSGSDFGALTAKKALLSQTKADGSYILSITDSAKTGFYVAVGLPNGTAPVVSAQLVSGNYGA
ncbi:MAG TPA: hypothetical protein VMH41_16785 [Mycobacteriales bacterium]|nr:hypothetical protein [Mycobacteriales bacterium]